MSRIAIYSRPEMEALLADGFPENIAVISFYDTRVKPDPNYKPIDFQDKPAKLLLLGIDDLNELALSLLHEPEENFFTEAPQVAQFIHEALRTGMDIICQCEHGQGRSAACAAAIMEYTNNSGAGILTDKNLAPNRVIFRKLLQALREQAPEQGGNPQWDEAWQQLESHIQKLRQLAAGAAASADSLARLQSINACLAQLNALLQTLCARESADLRALEKAMSSLRDNLETNFL